jgi:dTDP-4-dehydrorhamnose 3,5-epimerase
VKIVRCTRGSVYDVIVDLRTDSPTYRRWYGVELNDRNYRMIYVPQGFAQGYLTLLDESEIYYHASQRYDPPSASGVRFDDPAFGIVWPTAIRSVSDQDRAWPDYGTREPAFPRAGRPG